MQLLSIEPSPGIFLIIILLFAVTYAAYKSREHKNSPRDLTLNREVEHYSLLIIILQQMYNRLQDEEHNLHHLDMTSRNMRLIKQIETTKDELGTAIAAIEIILTEGGEPLSEEEQDFQESQNELFNNTPQHNEGAASLDKRYPGIIL